MMHEPVYNEAALPITACSVVTACGVGTQTLHSALLGAEHSLRAPTLFELGFRTLVGQVNEALPDLAASLQAYSTRNTRLTLAAIDSPGDGLRNAVNRAVERYGAERIGVILGTSTSGMYETEQAYCYRQQYGHLPADYVFERQHAWVALVDYVSGELGLSGPRYVISTACSSGSRTIAAAQRLIRTGFCDAVLAGGIDSLCRLTLNGFKSLDLVAEGPCTPLDRDRDGISIGEGAGLMLIERPQPEWRHVVHLLGCGESSDAHHMAAPHPEGVGAIMAMRQALAQAGLAPDMIDYVNLHATGTRQNDAVEMAAMAEVFGEQVQCGGTKGLTGHTLGAAGAVEAAICWLALTESFLPGTCGLRNADPTFCRPVISAPRLNAKVNLVMNNNFGFGGNNASMIFGLRRD